MDRKKKFGSETCCAFLPNADVDSAHVSLFGEKYFLFTSRGLSLPRLFHNEDCDFECHYVENGRIVGLLIMLWGRVDHSPTKCSVCNSHIMEGF